MRKKGFSMIEIIVSIIIISIITVGVVIIIHNKPSNQKEIEKTKEKILLSSSVFLDSYNVIENTKEELGTNNICIEISYLYETGHINDKMYQVAIDSNYKFVQYSKEDINDGTLVADDSSCIIYDPNEYVKPIEPPKQIEVLLNYEHPEEKDEIENYINAKEFKDYLKKQNIELKVSFANFNQTNNSTYEWKQVVCGTNSNDDTMAILGNNIVMQYWDRNWTRRRMRNCNVWTGTTSESFTTENGTSITPMFDVEYVTRFRTHYPTDRVETSETYSYFLTDSTRKKLVYQIHTNGETGRCDVDSDETQWSNAGDYGYYYLKWYYCSLGSTNDIINCNKEIEKEIYSGALKDSCEWRRDKQYESPSYDNLTHFNLGDQSMVSSLQNISTDNSEIKVYDYIGGIPTVPESIKNYLSISKLYSLSLLPTASKNKYDAYEVTYNNEKIYYKNGDWYGTPIYTSHKPGSSWRYNYYINWVKENKTTIYSFNNVNREGNIIDCNTNLCMSYKRVISTTGVNNINSLDDIKQLIENYMAN